MRQQALLPVTLVLLALFGGTAERAQANTRTFAKPELVRPFRVEIDQKDLLLANIMLCLLSDSGVEGSFRFYRAIRDELRWTFVPGKIDVPTSVALFPRDRPPLETAKRWCNIVRYTTMPRGGHFAALEQPELFVKTCAKASGPLADRQQDSLDHE
jgi:pimeloyl-ACP methyl ester carboxylesterase